VHLHRLVVGEHHGTVVDADALLAEEQLRRAGLEAVARAVEYAAQDDLRSVVDEIRRDRDVALEQAGVERLQVRRGEQLAAEAQHDAVVLARIRVGNRLDFIVGNLAPRLFEERRVQRPLDPARIRHGRELGARVIQAQVVVGHDETTVGPLAQELVAAGWPEIHQDP
jgi:hypothetical protein